uniref:Uncharacterized protein n=1 Tax=Rhizophora mucronata TaxID=61149 RepID=A0A2P2QYD1_RHIMU
MATAEMKDSCKGSHGVKTNMNTRSQHDNLLCYNPFHLMPNWHDIIDKRHKEPKPNQ